jgi:F0F1-type ATP synthase epsilon subunit
VALGSLYSQSERLFHLEIQLHQALVTELAGRNNTIELQRTTPLPGGGLLQLQEHLVEIIATEFVRQTRFDPRHKATTEQLLYDALPAALRALQSRAETNVDVNGYQARISAQQLQAAGQRLFDSARECMGRLRPDDHVLADPLAALLPGLTGAFTRLDIVGTDDVCRALQLHQEQLIQREQDLSFVTTLPCLEEKIIPRAAPVSSPTHVLYRHVARPLHESGTALAGGCEIYRSKDGWQLRGADAATMVNGARYFPDQILASGDAITIGGGSAALLIEVVA